MSLLDGHRAIVTGGGSGIGRATCTRMAEEGATVAVLDLLGLVDAAQCQALATWREPVIRNYRGLATGRVQPTVRLERRS